MNPTSRLCVYWSSAAESHPNTLHGCRKRHPYAFASAAVPFDILEGEKNTQPDLESYTDSSSDSLALLCARIDDEFPDIGCAYARFALETPLPPPDFRTATQNPRYWDSLIRIASTDFPGKAFSEFLDEIGDLHLTFRRCIAETLPAADVYHAFSCGFDLVPLYRAARANGVPLVVSLEHCDGGRLADGVPAPLGVLGLSGHRGLSGIRARSVHRILREVLQYASAVLHLPPADLSILSECDRMPEAIELEPLVGIPESCRDSSDPEGNAALGSERETVSERDPRGVPLSDTETRPGGTVPIDVLGPIVPENDIKTVFSAIGSIPKIPQSTFFRIRLSSDDDPAYREDCLAAAAGMGLEGRLKVLDAAGNGEQTDSPPSFMIVPALGTDAGTAVFRSLSRGILPLAPSIPLNQEILQFNKRLLYHPQQPASLAERIEFLLQNPDFITAARFELIRRFEIEYSLRYALSQYARLYAKLGVPS